MRFSFWISTQHTWDETLDLAGHAEATGWDGLWIADHFMPNDDTALDQPMHEALALLGALAATVPRLRLGSLVLGFAVGLPAYALVLWGVGEYRRRVPEAVNLEPDASVSEATNERTPPPQQ